MSEEKKQFPTPEMLKAEEEWAKKTPQEREAIENKLREKLRKRYENGPSRRAIMNSRTKKQPE